jgi:hypothetical protein
MMWRWTRDDLEEIQLGLVVAAGSPQRVRS